MINGMKEQLKHAYNIGQKVRADKNIVNLKENGEGEILSNSTFPWYQSENWELPCLCCLYDFQVYTGKSGKNAKRGLAHQVVTDLVVQLNDKGTVLYIDNFFAAFAFPFCRSWKDFRCSAGFWVLFKFFGLCLWEMWFLSQLFSTARHDVIDEFPHTKQGKDVNRRSALATNEVGPDRESMATIYVILNMPAPLPPLLGQPMRMSFISSTSLQ